MQLYEFEDASSSPSKRSYIFRLPFFPSCFCSIFFFFFHVGVFFAQNKRSTSLGGYYIGTANVLIFLYPSGPFAFPPRLVPLVRMSVFAEILVELGF